jgi:hypothetical protein
MAHIPGYISPENKKEVEELMKPRREATTKEEIDKARKEINEKVFNDTKNARDRIN